MDLFDERNLDRISKDSSKLEEFKNNKINIQIFSSKDPNTSFDSLLHVKYLFQKMLPKMPKDYILRQVFDSNHCCMTLNEKIENKENTFRIIGGVLFRPCFERKLVEIVFLAIDSEYHVNGYGTFLFNCFKEICKLQYSMFFKIGHLYNTKNIIVTDLSIFDNIDTVNFQDLYIAREESNQMGTACSDRRYTEDDNLYLLTYADNSAIGFFKKQGFSLHPRSTEWIGYIKDYEGGTLMECKIHKKINYIHKNTILKCLRDKIFSRMKNINDFHILRDPSKKDELEDIKTSITCKGTGIRSKENFLSDFLYFLISSLQSHPSAWPFLEPVSVKDVPDYFNVIKFPMDMSLVMSKIKNGRYQLLEDFKDDIYLICNNCFRYNSPETQYYKCAENIKRYFDGLISKYSFVISKWEC